MKQYLKEYIDTLFKDNLLTQIVKFDLDIDSDKNSNCKYTINSQGHLKFLYKQESLLQSDEWEESESSIEQILPKSSETIGEENTDYNYHCISKLHYKKADLIVIDLQDNKVPAQILLCNNQHRQLFFDYIEKGEENISLNTSLLEGILIQNNHNRNLINYYKNNKYNNKDTVHQLTNNKWMSIAIDVNNKEIISWDNEAKTSKSSINEWDTNNSINSIIFSKALHTLTQNNKSICKPKVDFGKKEGYIYLKPIELNIKQSRLMMHYSGSPVIEWYNYKRDQWEEIRNEQVLDADRKVELRIKMGTNDIVYHMFFTSKEKDKALYSAQSFLHNNLLKYIDAQKSGYLQKRYFEGHQYVEFIADKESESMNNSLMMIYGKHIKSSNIFIPDKVKTVELKETESVRAIINKPIEKDKLIIGDISSFKDGMLYINIINEYTFNTESMLYSGELYKGPIHQNRMNSNENKGIYFFFDKIRKRIQINKTNDEGWATFNISDRKFLDQESFTIAFDIKTGNILLNGELVYKNELQFKFGDNEKAFIGICYYPNAENNNSDNSLKIDIMQGKNEGYVYFNPIDKLAANKNFTVQHNSARKLEYYSYEQQQWLDYYSDLNLINQQEISLRLNMKRGERIFNIIY